MGALQAVGPRPGHGFRGAAIGRTVVGTIWLAGAAFNLTVTRGLERPYEWLAEGSAVPVYRWFFGEVVAAHPVAWTVALALGEAALGVLTLSPRRWATVGLAGSVLMSLFLFSLMTPYTMMMGPYALLVLLLLRAYLRGTGSENEPGDLR
ncbi:MAG: hypothetical protein M3Y37_02585 [Chloroflexota bacterium]|nr:hypothetical protein [Chloroflexota bacterium]